MLGTLRVTKALLPLLEASEAGTIVMISSTAGLIVYEGGGGYSAAKHAQTALAETLRLELCGRPVRVVEIDPGMVRTDEFALNRFARRRRAGRRGLRRRREPLTADDIADCVAWCATRPHHVNIDRLVVRPLAQAAQHKVHRVASDVNKQTVSREPQGDGHPRARRTPTGCGGWTTGSPRAAPALRDAADPLVVDLGYGATPVTAVELRARLAPGAAGRPGRRAGDRPGAGRRRRAGRRPAGADLRAGAASSWPGCARSWCGRSTCCGSTTRARSRRPGRR